MGKDPRAIVRDIQLKNGFQFDGDDFDRRRADLEEAKKRLEDDTTLTAREKDAARELFDEMDRRVLYEKFEHLKRQAFKQSDVSSQEGKTVMRAARPEEKKRFRLNKNQKEALEQRLDELSQKLKETEERAKAKEQEELEAIQSEQN